MNRKAIVLAAVLAGAPLAAMAQAYPTPAESGAGMSSSIVIQIQPQNDSGEQGTASLTPMGDSSTKVSISLTGGPSDVAQPAHIHSGSCANLDPKPEYPLESVTNGHSTTVVPVSLQKLLSSADAINVHKSASEISTYVACGDIVKANAMREIPGVALVDYF